MNYTSTASFDNFDILSSDASRNPDFYDWTGVYIKFAAAARAATAYPYIPTLALGRYCDSSSYSGYVEGPVLWQGNKLFFRGFANLDAVRTRSALNQSPVALLNSLPP